MTFASPRLAIEDRWPRISSLLLDRVKGRRAVVAAGLMPTLRPIVGGFAGCNVSRR